MNKSKSAMFCALLAASSVVVADQSFNSVESGILNAMISDDISCFVNNQNSLINKIWTKEGKSVTIVDPFVFSVDYNENEIRANQKYKDKTLYFRNCQVSGISAGITDAPIISCLSPAAYQAPQLHFSNTKESLDFAAQLRRGSRIDAVCSGAGEIAGLPMADDCRPNTELLRSARDKLTEIFTDKNSASGALCSSMVVRAATLMTPEQKEKCAVDCSIPLQEIRGKLGKSTDWLETVKPRLLELGFQIGVEKLEAQLNEKK